MATRSPYQIARAIDLGLDSIKFSTGDSAYTKREINVPCGWFCAEQLRPLGQQRQGTANLASGERMQIRFDGETYCFATASRSSHGWFGPTFPSDLAAPLVCIAAAVKLMQLPAQRIDHLVMSTPFAVNATAIEGLKRRLLVGIEFDDTKIEIGDVHVARAPLCSLLWAEAIKRSTADWRSSRLILQVGNAGLAWFLARGLTVNASRSGFAAYEPGESVGDALSHYLPGGGSRELNDERSNAVESELCGEDHYLFFHGHAIARDRIATHLNEKIDQSLRTMFRGLGDTADIHHVVLSGLYPKLHAARIKTMFPHLKIDRVGSTSADARFAGVRGMQLVAERFRDLVFVS